MDHKYVLLTISNETIIYHIYVFLQKLDFLTNSNILPEYLYAIFVNFVVTYRQFKGVFCWVERMCLSTLATPNKIGWLIMKTSINWNINQNNERHGNVPLGVYLPCVSDYWISAPITL